MVLCSRVTYGKISSTTTDDVTVFFLNPWKEEANTLEISGMVYLFYLLNMICFQSVQVSVFRSVCSIM